MQELSLILKSETYDTNTDSYPQAYYLVMASSNSTLLIKSVVMEELMLPSNFPSLSEKTSQQSTEIIEGCLDMVGRLYSMLYHSYCIYHSLVNLPYLVIPYHTIPCHAMPYTLPYHTIPGRLQVVVILLLALFQLFRLYFQLPVQDVYNPFFMKSNLFKFFISKTLKNNPGSRGNKRKFQAPQVGYFWYH